MKRIPPFFLILSIVSCVQDLEYDISDADKTPVINALWSASDMEHAVYICQSGAYKVEEVDDDINVCCHVNDSVKAETDAFETVTSRSGATFRKYTLSVRLEEGDDVELFVKMPDREMRAKSVVPQAPRVRLDTVSVDKSFRDINGRASHIVRDYTVTLSLEDFPGERSYFRFHAPSLHVESHDIKTDTLIAQKDIDYIEFDENDPVFKNVPIHFPDEIMRELPFLGASVSNSSHVFSDELFEDGTYSFVIPIQESRYIPATTGTGEYVTYQARFRLAALSKDEYAYLLSANAVNSIFLDPMAEPITMPSNVENGIGVFSINYSFDKTIRLEDQLWPWPY